MSRADQHLTVAMSRADQHLTVAMSSVLTQVLVPSCRPDPRAHQHLTVAMLSASWLKS